MKKGLKIMILITYVIGIVLFTISRIGGPVMNDFTMGLIQGIAIGLWAVYVRVSYKQRNLHKVDDK